MAKQRKFGKRIYLLVWDSKVFDVGFGNRDTKRGIADRKRVAKLWAKDKREEGDYFVRMVSYRDGKEWQVWRSPK